MLPNYDIKLLGEGFAYFIIFDSRSRNYWLSDIPNVLVFLSISNQQTRINHDKYSLKATFPISNTGVPNSLKIPPRVATKGFTSIFQRFKFCQN